jgi:tetratricopeptide (TPR) repeat protein
MLRLSILSGALLAAGCAVQGPARPALDDRELLSRPALLDPAAVERPITPAEIFALDADMRAFVRERLVGIRSSEARLRRLLNGMQEQGLFSLSYDAGVTRTASDTFHTRTGNCLSFTVLFVTLAREAGLDARYQMVDIPPEWSTESDLILLSSHINALIETDVSGDFVVDFNMAELKGNYDTRIVSDSYALGLFYSNLGVDALLAGDYSTSFTRFKAAIESYPRITGPWVNLGLLYARLGEYARAEATYLRALEIEPGNRSALTNLASVYAATGDHDKAAAYSEEVRRYQQRNPYYHYSLAQRAYEERRFRETLEHLRPALRRKRNEHQFHYLRALAHAELGEQRDAERSLAEAGARAELPELKARYATKLEAFTQR